MHVFFQDVYFLVWLQAMLTKHMRHIRYWKSCHFLFDRSTRGLKVFCRRRENRKGGGGGEKTGENSRKHLSMSLHMPAALSVDENYHRWKHEVWTRALPDSILLKVNDTGLILPHIKAGENYFQTHWRHVNLVHLVVLFYRKHVKAGVKSPPKEW